MVGGGDASIRVQPHSALPTQVRIQPHSAQNLLRSGYNPTQHYSYSGQDTTPLSTTFTGQDTTPLSTIPTQVRKPFKIAISAEKSSLSRLQQLQLNMSGI